MVGPDSPWPSLELAICQGAVCLHPGRQKKPVHTPEGGVNRQEVGSVFHPRSQRKQPENVPKGSLHWELWQQVRTIDDMLKECFTKAKR